MIKDILIILIASFFISGCGGLNQNIQRGNITGNVEDNKWDYYDGQPVHYTSVKRRLYKNKILVSDEKTDKFNGMVTIDKSKDIAYIIFNDKTFTLTRVSKLLDNKIHENWYRSAVMNGFYFVNVNYQNQSVMTSYHVGDEFQQIEFLPSRYLACRKIAAVKKEHDKKVAVDLLRTALVAGVQSYTSYSTTSYSSAYGDNGYSVTRDYSWAGDRASDALEFIFAGQLNNEKIQQAWNGMNCW